MKRKLALVQLFKHREPALLVTGQAISNFGDGIALVALTLLVLSTTHDSVVDLSWFAAARMTPLVLFLLIGGAIVDRFSRRILLLISDGARALLTAALVTLIFTHTLHFWELMVFSVLFGAFDALFFPCITAFTPEIVPEELLPAMNAVRPLSNNLVGNVLGPMAGGLLAAFSSGLAMSIDGVTFIASFLALSLMHPTAAPLRDKAKSMLHDIKEGLGYVAKTRWLWTTLIGVTLMNAFVFTPMVVLIPYFILHKLHAAKIYVGVSAAIGGTSGAVGGLVAANLPVPKRRIRVMWTYWIIASLSAFIVGFATNFWILVVFPFIAFPMMILGNVIFESMMQSEVPRELLGRASSVDWFVSLGMSPIGLIVAGQIADAVGVRTYFVAVAIICTLPALWIVKSNRINAIDAPRLHPS